MNPSNEIVQITSKVLSELNPGQTKMQPDSHAKVDGNVVNAIGMIVEECIENSLQAGVHRMLTRDSSKVKMEDISSYIRFNYGISEKRLDKYSY